MLYRADNPHGGDIYEGNIILDFSANTNPLGTPAGVIDAMRAALDEAHRYPDPYCRSLVRAIAEHENVPCEYILCGNGAAELIYSYCEALKPFSAVETAPTFSEYSSALERVGCKISRYILRKDADFDFDTEFIYYLDKIKPDAVFLCNPNNPTGRLINSGLLEEILEFCGKRGIKLFVDECFLDLSDGFDDLVSNNLKNIHDTSIKNAADNSINININAGMKKFLKKYPNLFILKAFTKSYGMAGVRLGYCMCSDSGLLGKMAKTSQPWNVSSIAQAAGIAALKESEFLQKTRAIIHKERKWLKHELESTGFWVCDSKANYLLFDASPTALDLSKALKEQFGIALRNCSNYNGLATGWYRTAVRLHNENEQLINCIKEVLEKR